jgi:hypothetical protein
VSKAREATARFALGRVVVTPSALQRAEEHGLNLLALLARHVVGDWGETCAQDKRTNDAAVKDGSRILSVYGEGNERIWIITDSASDVCPACWAGIGECEPDKGEWLSGTHFRTDRPPRRVSTTILRPEDY